MNLHFDVITLFADIFKGVSELGVTGRAHRQGLWQLHTWNPRDYTHDLHKTVDDRPYGGGPGMVMLAEPLKQACLAIEQTHQQSRKTILLSPCGEAFTQRHAQNLLDIGGATLICGRYEGIDQRFIDHYVDQEISLGDFVLSGGEIAAMALIDATVRLLPNTLNDRQSYLQDSFQESIDGLLDCPHYTRPEVFEGKKIPSVLNSGHHENIKKWRRAMSLALTQKRRPDLIIQARQAGKLSKEDEKIIEFAYKNEN